MENGERRMKNGGWRMEDGGWKTGKVEKANRRLVVKMRINRPGARGRVRPF